ncbi:MAG: hypothetical protein JXL97_13375 [Bacteroidales bacterium]|nr:hypothetical protein [Bacteroidales bacterium]
MIVEFVFAFAVVGIVVALVFLIFRQVIKCPDGKALIVYHKENKDAEIKVYTKGKVYVKFLSEDYSFLDLRQMTTKLEIEAETADNMNVRSHINVEFGVSLEPVLLKKAVEHFVEKSENQILEMVQEVVQKLAKTYFSKMYFEKKQLNIGKKVHDLSDIWKNEFEKMGLELYRCNFEGVKVL